MGRIRTVKPELFKHEKLFEAEFEYGTENKMPIRLAFIALFTCADRDGKFKWRPKTLKLDCLPYDDVNFENILNILEKYGFILSYTINGQKFGQIASFSRHQIVNHRESKSEIPDYSKEFDASTTREPRVNHASTTRDPRGPGMPGGKGRERKGKEGKGKEGEKGTRAPHVDQDRPPPVYDDHILFIFNFWSETMKKRDPKLLPKRKAKIVQALKHYSPDQLQKAIMGCAKTEWNMGKNPDGKVYDDLELILRDEVHIERFIQNFEKNDCYWDRIMSVNLE